MGLGLGFMAGGLSGLLGFIFLGLVEVVGQPPPRKSSMSACHKQNHHLLKILRQYESIENPKAQLMD